jgi:hypothetical protein
VGLYYILYPEVLGEKEEEGKSSLELWTNKMNDVLNNVILDRGDYRTLSC